MPESATPSPKIAVVVLNYNAVAYTLRCLESLLKYTAKLSDAAVIVVDNNSTAVDKEQLASIPQKTARLIFSDRNLGFAGGMMLGAQAVTAEYYFFLNSDCELLNDAVGVLCEFMDSRPDAALCSGSMFDADGRPRSGFGYFPSLALALFGSSLLRLFRPRRYPNRRRLYQHPIEVDVVTGAAMFVRGATLRQLHGLDSGYFLYCEEEDFARRVREGGGKVYHVPQARIRHIGGGSSEDIGLRPALHREYYISFCRYLRLHHSAISAFAFRLLVAGKILRRALRGKVPFNLIGFVLRGAPERESLRYRQNQ